MEKTNQALHFFERALLPGRVYPCSLDDIACRLSELPEQDREGLWAVGLVPATNKNSEVDGRYYFGERPAIHLFSYPETLRFKLMPHTKRHEIERVLAVQLRYGMDIESHGSRYVCIWSPENLRRFFIEHVLLHEVGHHVFFWQRKQQGLRYTPQVAGAEQYAEAYALKYRR